MGSRRSKSTAGTLALVAVAALALGVAARASDAPAARPAGKEPAKVEPLIQANTPPFTEGLYPCSTCHDPKAKVDATRRDLGFHNGEGEPAAVYAHDAANRWCLDCHDAQERDVLRSASGQHIPFTESWRLCGQCHGDKLRDWKVGVHGKRVGMWNGAKTYFLCVNCHNPHTPRWKGVKEVVVDGKKVVTPTLELLKPEPRPRRPEEMRK